ncbi:cell separation during budding [Gaertneriomyces sp. JEL0708]|nr:cell separation during budding [Gaertneriomyces sp. JEL0708]
MTDSSVSPDGTLTAVLTAITCGALISSPDYAPNKSASRPKHPLCLDSELSVTEGCEALAANKITSAPVYDASKGGFIGMLDYRDLVAFVLSVLHKVPKEAFVAEATMDVSDIVKRALMKKSEVPIKLVSNLSHLNPLVPVRTDTPVRDAIEEFVKHKVHRAVVLQPENNTAHFAGILSQSTIAAYVASKVGKLAGTVDPKQPSPWKTGNKTLEQLGLVGKEVVSIVPDDTVLDALHIMYERKISSVAIVEKSDVGNTLAGSISMTDIKAIFSSKRGWRRLYDKSFDFFTSMRFEQGLEAGGDDRAPSFTVHPTTTLIATIEKMAATRGHRVWLVDAHNVLLGVVSLSDIMPLLLT